MSSLNAVILALLELIILISFKQLMLKSGQVKPQVSVLF